MSASNGLLDDTSPQIAPIFVAHPQLVSLRMLIEALSPGYARVSDPETSAGSKEYVPVSAEHERAIAEHQAAADTGVPAGMFGSKRRVRFNCTFDVMGMDGKVSQMRAGFEKVYDPKHEKMDDRACAGLAYKNPTWEQETLALPNKAYPTMEGWHAVRANKLQPAFPKSYGVTLGGR